MRENEPGSASSALPEVLSACSGCKDHSEAPPGKKGSPLALQLGPHIPLLLVQSDGQGPDTVSGRS